jgi:hypothetical protein
MFNCCAGFKFLSVTVRKNATGVPTAGVVLLGVPVTTRSGDPAPPPPPPPPPDGGGEDATTVKADVLAAVPPSVVTATGPVLAPEGTDASISVGETTANTDATPLNVTAVAPVRLLPEIVTAVPTAPEPGVTEEMTGAGGGGVGGGAAAIVKSVALCALPLPVVTAIRPVAALVGTEAWIWEAETTW